MKLEAMDDKTVEGIIQKAVEDAVDFIEAEICLLYTSDAADE